MIKIVANGVALDLPADLSLQLTIENPILSTDRIPVAYTTNIDFPGTQTNLQVFGFQDKLLLRPTVEKVPATLYVNELRIVDGTLCFDSYEDRAIKASFVGASIDDVLSKDLSSIDLQRWIFGELTAEEQVRYLKLLNSGRDGNEVFVCAPVATAENPRGMADFINEYTSGYSTSRMIEGTLSRYFLDCYSPAIRLPYLLSKLMSSDMIFKNFDLSRFNDVVLLTGRNPEVGTYDVGKLGGLDSISESPEQYAFSLSASLPPTAAGELMKELFKLFCMSVYFVDGQYVAHLNGQIIGDKDFEDWNDRTADAYAISIERGQKYKYGFSSYENDFKMPDSMITVTGVVDMLAHPEPFSEETYFFIESTNEVYLRDGYRDTPTSEPDYQYKMVYQGYLSASDSGGEDSYDATVNVSVPRVKFGPGIRVAGGASQWQTVPVIDASWSDGRLSNFCLAIYLGYLPRLNENGDTTRPTSSYPVLSPTAYDMLGIRRSEASITWAGDNGLYNRYHKGFAEWIGRDRIRFRTEVNLSAIDLKNLQLFKKKLIGGKKFLIATINVEIDHEGVLPADVEFVEV